MIVSGFDLSPTPAWMPGNSRRPVRPPSDFHHTEQMDGFFNKLPGHLPRFGQDASGDAAVWFPG